ncbi:Probable NADH dehydrogenase [Striga hermonthica]|uniref:Probable NADH dehydrogenase n=1 Tax=Striga hermonthica TaxID=68872 RepID=A0A9N7MLV4_STRHE|nr:Probable NADH dehydrogenase [Striga hermonthica]
MTSFHILNPRFPTLICSSRANYNTWFRNLNRIIRNATTCKNVYPATARPFMVTSKVKETTGIVGLDVVPNARKLLVRLYNKTLEQLKAVLKEEGYRMAVESFT